MIPHALGWGLVVLNSIYVMEEMKKENTAMENFLAFEQNMLSSPRTFFPMFEAGLNGRRNIIWKEYIDWQSHGGKTKDHNIRAIGDKKDILTWGFGDEYHAQRIDLNAPFSIEHYKAALNTVFSFMGERPQYFKFRKMEGIFNPLRLLLYNLL